ncbi:alpha-L-rhamnosidase-related protein [Bacillus solitudinis]|uniref:alpha-L-rhamnosidase-related protein n=1 Tax=Bacillus solitudinis TaxID=2014074 RepID=UPI000C2322ED|nr:family 78 glycoside hydrolase catalytic domain [Bacillus solitudinis]
MSFQISEWHNYQRKSEFEKKADNQSPKLYQKIEYPENIIQTEKGETIIHSWKTVFVSSADKLSETEYGKGDSFILDFGEHLVGYLSFDVKPVGSPPDAPLKIRLTFGEMPVEVSESFAEYDGWISSSWLQEETLHIDILPENIVLPRRYSFRYLKVDVLDTSPKYRVVFENVSCNSVTSADTDRLVSFKHHDVELEKIDKVSIKTLQDCMQEVFEDGPKRDRRLWLGDLRLQALTNYVTFRHFDLVKGNLYLFAAVPNMDGMVSANLFIKPKLIPDDTFLFDYSLFFTTTLYDYYKVTKDLETLNDLWETAYKQIELAINRVQVNGIVQDDTNWWSFIDWHSQLNKQTPSQAILIYAINRALELAKVLGRVNEVNEMEETVNRLIYASKNLLWSADEGYFISGDERQVSWASQVWMVLAEVVDREEGKRLLRKLIEEEPKIGMNTPYMHHHFVEALLLVGAKDEAIWWLKNYWGGMISDGADTFWELYNPEDKSFSPYGNHLINSYCHAWSCTPSYLIRTYLK